MDSCYICHNFRFDKRANCWLRKSTVKLVPQKLTWNMFDGTPVTIDIHYCEECIKEYDEIMSFKEGGSWITEALKKLGDSEKAQKAATMLFPVGILVKEVIA